MYNKIKIIYVSIYMYIPHYITYSQRVLNVQGSLTRQLACHYPGFPTFKLYLKHFEIISLGNRRILLNNAFLIIGILAAIVQMSDSATIQPSNYFNALVSHTTSPRPPITYDLLVRRTNLLKIFLLGSASNSTYNVRQLTFMFFIIHAQE